MVSSDYLINNRESNRLIIEKYETKDDFGNVTDGVGFAWNARKKQEVFNRNLFEDTLKKQKQDLEQFNRVYNETLDDVGNADKAFDAASAAISSADDATKKYTQTAAKGTVDIEKFEQAQRAGFESQQKGLKGLSTGAKAMLGNIGATLAIGAAFSLVELGWNKFNDDHKITADKKLEAMETAVNDYNDAISQSKDNISTIQSLQSEFNDLSKGVDDSGKNIGLSADEFDRYNQIVSQLAGISPSIVKSYSAEGNAIVDRNNAIQEGIKYQQEYAQAAHRTYTSNSTGDDIIAGAGVNIREATRNMRKEAKNVAKNFNDYYAASGVGKDTAGASASSKELNDILGTNLDIEKASAEQLKNISDRREEILKKAKESGKYSEEELTNIDNALISLGDYAVELETSTQPIYDWLSAYAAQAGIGNMSEVFSKDLPDGMQEAYESGLKQIAATGTDAAGMKTAARELSKTLSDMYSDNTGKYRDILKAAAKAQEDFMDSDRLAEDADEYNEILGKQADQLDALAEKYSETDAALAASLQSQANSMRDFVNTNELSLENAVHGFDDYIEKARTVKADFDETIKSGDYYTAINGFKEIYDTMFDGKNNLGNGSLSWWTGAEMMLGSNTLSKLGYDIDKVKAKIKELKPALKGGETATSFLFNKLAKEANNTGKIVDEFGEKIATVEKASDGTVSFDIPEENYAAVARQLGVSTEMLTAMVDNARQFANVDFHNVDEVVKALEASEIKTTGKDDTLFANRSNLEAETNLHGKELDNLVKDLESRNVQILDTASSVKKLKSQLVDLGTASTNNGITKINVDDTLKKFNEMGMSLEDVDYYFRRLQKDNDVEFKGDTSDIADAYTELQNADEIDTSPLGQAQTAVEALRTSIDTLITTLGGVPPLNIEVAETTLSDVDSSIKEIEKKANIDASGMTENERQEYVVDIKTEISGELDKLSALENNLEGLPEDKRVEVQAQIDDQRSKLSGFLEQLSTLDGKDYRAALDLKMNGNLPGRIEEVEEGLGSIDGTSANASLEVKDNTTGAVEGANQSVDSFGGKIARAFLTADNSNATAKAAAADASISSIPTLWNSVFHGNDVNASLNASLVQSAVTAIPISRTINFAASGVAAVQRAAAAVKAAISGTSKAKGTAKRRKGRQSIDSMARGGGKRKGGLTLTGELAPELVWLPSQQRSFIAGQFGPEMLYLPSDAVVYPGDETKRILAGRSKHKSFDSLSGGTSATGSYKPKTTTVEKSTTKTTKTTTTSGGSSKSTSSSSSSKSSSSKEDPKVKKYNSKKDKLDHQLEMGYISEKTYYKKLNKLYKKYLKNNKKATEEKRQALEDLKKAWNDAYEAEKDNLDHKLKMGTITEAQYYNKLAALGKKYYTKNGKVRKGYSDEYKKWQEDLVDAAKDAFDDEQDALDKKLEKGLISIEKYYSESKKLRDKYLGGKANADNKKEAAENAHENFLDGLEDQKDELDQLIADKDLFSAWEVGETPITLLEGWQKQLKEWYKAGMITAKEYKEYWMEAEREIADYREDRYDDQKDSLDDIFDLIEATIRQEAEDRIDALEKSVDLYQDIIDKKKKSLSMTEDELSYQEELNDNSLQISKLQAEIAALSRDDSRAAKAKLAEKQEELNDLLKERNQTVRDETLNKTEDALDEQADLFEELVQKEIDKIQEFLDNQAAVNQAIMDQIANRDDNDLYERVLAYNLKYGDGFQDTVDNFWDELQGLLKVYGDDIEEIVKILRRGTEDKKDSTGGDNPSNTGGKIPTPPTHHSGLKAGFTGDGASLKQNEVWRKLTDDELVLNKADQLKLGQDMKILESIKKSYSGLAKSTALSPIDPVVPSIEINIDSPITIEGNASSDVVKQLENYSEKLANTTLTKLNDALLRNGVRTKASSNARKN